MISPPARPSLQVVIRPPARLAAFGQDGVDRHRAATNLRDAPGDAPFAGANMQKLQEPRLQRMGGGARRQ
jgi:hypothetical protein